MVFIVLEDFFLAGAGVLGDYLAQVAHFFLVVSHEEKFIVGVKGDEIPYVVGFFDLPKGGKGE